MAVFGGVYGNWQALRAFLEAAQTPPEMLVCTGDLAGYCADGAAVCAFARQNLIGAVFARGNCERAVAADEEDCGCGFAPGTVCERLSAAWHAHAKNSINAEDKTWLGELPARRIIRFGGRRLAVLHADAETDNNFIFASSPAAQKRRALEKLGVDGVIAGHGGIPFTQKLGEKIWHNSGALGMPANDGTPRVWYSRWFARAGGIEIRHYPLEYDVAGAQEAMRRAKLPPEYRESLQSGIWPSDSVLPPREKKRQGKPLNPPPYFW
ncbi:MAG: metallophosphoesterase family protein, partial [Gammaproteobacteria bacterium]